MTAPGATAASLCSRAAGGHRADSEHPREDSQWEHPAQERLKGRRERCVGKGACCQA